MLWERMTLDEFAEYRQANGKNAQKIGDTWWVEVRPFFYRPLFPFAEINPKTKQYPLKSLIGGVLHAVPQGSTYNSCMNFFVYDNLQNYSLNKLSKKRKKITENGLCNFELRREIDIANFISYGHSVYISFYNRTKYDYENNLLKKPCFERWAKMLFDNSKLTILGIYHDKKLTAYEISYYVENVIFAEMLLMDDRSLRMKANDFILHKLREAASYTDAEYIYLGLPTGKQSLDYSKIIRGCKLLKVPAYCRINPVALFAAKHFMKDSYAKLIAACAINFPLFADMDKTIGM